MTEDQLVEVRRRTVAFVFQAFGLVPFLTATENVEVPLRLVHANPRERDARVATLLDIVGLSERAKHRPHELSGGEQQRVALARALVFEPPLVLLDEPLGALDKQLREEMQLEIRHIHERLGVTMVYVTHDQAEALTMADRVAIMRKGVLQYVGTPTQVYGRPATLYVAAFLASGLLHWWFGAAIGFVHAMFVLLVGMRLLPGIHPRMADELRGPDPTRQLEPPGYMALNYGRGTPLTTVLAHIVYGVVLGMFYR